MKLLAFVIVITLAILLELAIWFFYRNQLIEIDKQIEQEIRKDEFK